MSIRFFIIPSSLNFLNVKFSVENSPPSDNPDFLIVLIFSIKSAATSASCTSFANSTYSLYFASTAASLSVGSIFCGKSIHFSSFNEYNPLCTVPCSFASAYNSTGTPYINISCFELNSDFLDNKYPSTIGQSSCTLSKSITICKSTSEYFV